MKKYLFIIILLAVLSHSKTYAAATDSTLKMLPDGRYFADVAYYNYATYTSADYNVKIKVKDGFVKLMYLNNGGVVHDGINSEGYQFTGGKIKVSKDKHTGKLEYTTQITISNGNNISSYNIHIEKEAAGEAE
jgi:hypothetical protein